jgi:hypothetical protein
MYPLWGWSWWSAPSFLPLQSPHFTQWLVTLSDHLMDDITRRMSSSGIWNPSSYLTGNITSPLQNPRLMLCKIWGCHGGDYEEFRLRGYKNPVRTSQKTHYVSATESSRLMLCKIWGCHGGHYEECRLRGYKIQVRTSQEALLYSWSRSVLGSQSSVNK